MPNAADISVVIPTYNRASLIPRALASVRAQSVPVREIIVVDDGSTDDTEGAVRAQEPSARYVRQENAGAAAARNRGVAMATGAWIAFLDSDDEWLPTAVARRLAALNGLRAALVSADASAVNETGDIAFSSWLGKQLVLEDVRRIGTKPLPNAAARLARKNLVDTSLAMMPKEVFERVGGFDTSLQYGEDLELWIRIAAQIDVVVVPEVLGLRRLHSGNITGGREQHLKGLVRAAETIRRRSAATLRAQGCAPDRLVADAWASLGYWYFSQNRYREARGALSSSIAESMNARALFYAACCRLPEGFVGWLRSARQRLRHPLDA